MAQRAELLLVPGCAPSYRPAPKPQRVQGLISFAHRSSRPTRIIAVQPQERSAYLTAQAREHDPDRYLAALFAPAERREAVLALILFNHELARVPDVVRQPIAGYIRYQWWRDALDEAVAGQPPRQHPVAVTLAETLQRGWVAADPLQSLIDARERELEPMPAEDLAALENYLAQTSGLLQELVLACLGGGSADEQAAARAIGTAMGLVGVVHAIAHEARPQHQLLPPPLLAEAGHGRIVTMILARVDELLVQARRAAGRPARALMPAFLPARLVGAHARRIRAALDADPFRAAALARPVVGAPLVLLAAYLRRRP